MKKNIILLLLSVFIYGISYSQTNKMELIYTEPTRNETTEYTAVRIGEYYWINKNVHHKRNVFGQTIPWDVTQEQLNTYFGHMELPIDKYKVNLADFNYYYGGYYHAHTLYPGYGALGMTEPTLYNRETGQPISGFTLPYNDDFRQLFGMVPFFSGVEGRVNNYSIDQVAVRTALSPKKGENPVAFDIYSSLNSGSIERTYWFEHSTNIYGFNMMPNGGRIDQYHEESQRINGKDKKWPVYRGEIYQLFHVSKYFTLDGGLDVEDYLRFYTHTPGSMAGTWSGVRWCKRLSDDELGYKLFYNNNENEPDIRKVELKGRPASTVKAPAGYTELPKGYLRGLYLQYIIDNPHPEYSIEDILHISKCVEEKQNESKELINLDYRNNCDCSKLPEPKLKSSLQLEFDRAEDEHLYFITPGEEFTIFAKSTAPTRIRFGLFNTAGKFIRKIETERTYPNNYYYTGQISASEISFNNSTYLVMPYVEENGNVKIVGRDTDNTDLQHLVDKLLVRLATSIPSTFDFETFASDLDMTSNMRIYMGDSKSKKYGFIYSVDIEQDFDVTVYGTNLGDIQFGLFDVDLGTLEATLEPTDTPTGFPTRAQYKLKIADEGLISDYNYYILAPYTDNNGQVEFVNTQSGKMAVDRILLYVNTYYNPDNYAAWSTPFQTSFMSQSLEAATLSVYPNPVVNTLTLDSNENIISVEIYSVFGNLVKKVKNVKEVDMSGISAGTYFVKIKTDNNYYERTIVKK